MVLTDILKYFFPFSWFIIKLDCNYMYDFMYNVLDEMQHITTFVTNVCWQHMQLVLLLPLFTFSTLLTSTVPVFEIRQMIIDWTWALISFVAVKLKHITEVHGVQGFILIRWMVWGHSIIRIYPDEFKYGIWNSRHFSHLNVLMMFCI